MAIFDVFRRKPKSFNDQVSIPIQSVPAIKRQAIPTEQITKDTLKSNKVNKIGISYVRNATSGRENFEGPINVNFNTIANAYLTDSYIRQSVDKHVDFLFKAGYDIIGKDDSALEYVNARIRAIELAIGQSFESFLREVADELIKFHNVFIVKVRQPGSYKYPGNITATGIYSNKPVVAYFMLPASSITISRDVTGAVTKYRQEIPGVTGKNGEQYFDIKPEDMIHIYIDRPAGRAFGVPYLWEVLDDVKILRHLEELSVNMIYKNIFPLYVYTVGTPDAPAEEGEVDEVREYLGSDFTFNGGLVVPERHKINVESPGNSALDVTSYLDYYKKRSFAGLGVSPTLMGEGDTASRSTADTIDQGFKDRIKSFQKEIELAIQDKMFKELLLEGGFDFIENPDLLVGFRFHEIDLNSKIQKENHLVQMFTQNSITHDELRRELGLEPLSDEEMGRLYSRIITAFVNAEAAAQANTAANNSGDNKDQPANQSGKKLSPDKNKEFLELVSGNIKMDKYYNAMREDIVNAIVNDLKDKDLTFYAQYDIIRLGMIISLAIKNIKESINTIISSQFMQGVVDAKTQAGKEIKNVINIRTGIKHIQDTASERTNKVIEEISLKIIESIKRSTQDNLKENLERVFNKEEFRLVFLNNTEPMIAYNNGFMNTARAMEIKRVYIETEDTCEKCTAFDSIETTSDNIPPFHPNCKCKLVIKKEDNNA